MISFSRMKNKDSVSIIITSKNEDDVIKSLFLSIMKQTYKDIEIILVDNNSTDNTLKIAKAFNKIKIYTFGPERSAQRNYGAKKATCKYLLFLDADMKLTPTVVGECVKKIKAEKKIGGIAIPEESIAYNFWEKVKSFERSFYNERGDPITDAARFFPKEVFNKAGGYDQTITGPEDWDLPDNIRNLGYHTDRIESVIYHRERITSVFKLAQKKYYYGLKTYRYLRKHNIPPLSAKTVFFLRPIFYKNWKKIVLHPILSLALIFMLTLELIAGGMGYFIGRLSNK